MHAGKIKAEMDFIWRYSNQSPLKIESASAREYVELEFKFLTMNNHPTNFRGPKCTIGIRLGNEFFLEPSETSLNQTPQQLESSRRFLSLRSGGPEGGGGPMSGGVSSRRGRGISQMRGWGGFTIHTIHARNRYSVAVKWKH